MLSTGAAFHRQPTRRQAIAIRASAPAPVAPVAPPPAAPSPSAVGARGPSGEISLFQLAHDLQARTPTPSTTVPKAAAARGKSTPSTSSTTTLVPAAPTTTAKPAAAPEAPSTTTPLTPLTTLLQPVAPVAAAVLGRASWFYAPAGTCAHRDLPMGTLVRVTRTDTGASTTCRVSDRGPSAATNRVIDLSRDTFEKLASSNAGVINVKLEW